MVNQTLPGIRSDKINRPINPHRRKSEQRLAIKSLLKENIVDTIIGLPVGLFQTTGIPVAIMILDRSREPGGKNADRKDVLFIEASKEFKPGKTQNSLEPEHIQKILDAAEQRKDIEKFCRAVQPDEIAENDYNLNITRYVDTFEEEPEIDIEANLNELKTVDAELAKFEIEMQKHLHELGIGK